MTILSPETIKNAPTPEDVTLTITMHPNGQVECTGPIDNKILAYGLLEVAKEIVRMYQEQMINKQTQKLPLSFLKNMYGHRH